MKIDLSVLDGITKAKNSSKNGLSDNDGQIHAEANDGLERLFKGRFYTKLAAEREQAHKAAEICREYQENTRQAELLKSSITNGIQEGADLYKLLLLAMDAISRMTGDPTFYEHGKKNIQTIYGALGYDAPIAQEAQETQERLDRLLCAFEHETEEEKKRRISWAITAHRQRLEHLKANKRPE